jgi:hypothetical protein
METEQPSPSPGEKTGVHSTTCAITSCPAKGGRVVGVEVGVSVGGTGVKVGVEVGVSVGGTGVKVGVEVGVSVGV